MMLRVSCTLSFRDNRKKNVLPGSYIVLKLLNLIILVMKKVSLGTAKLGFIFHVTVCYTLFKIYKV